MKINQLFNAKIEDDALIADLLFCFNIDGFLDKTFFRIEDIKNNGGLKHFQEKVLSRLKNYYLPCKAKIYLVNLTEARMITILRQVLKMFGFKLSSIKRNKNKDKQIYYKIEKIGLVQNRLIIDINKNRIIKFD